MSHEVKAAGREAARHGVNFWVHLVATSDQYSDSLPAIQRRWSVGDIADAHRMLDYWSAVYDDQQPDSDELNNQGPFSGPGANNLPSNYPSNL